MTREDIINFFDKSLTPTCAYLDNKYSVFNGGCMYTSALIAKHLEENNINYDVIIYEHPNDFHHNTPLEMARDGDIRHVLIHVKLGSRDFYFYYDFSDKDISELDMKKHVFNMTSEEMMDIYRKCKWLGEFNTDDEPYVKDEIDMTFSGIEYM